MQNSNATLKTKYEFICRLKINKNKINCRKQLNELFLISWIAISMWKRRIEKHVIKYEIVTFNFNFFLAQIQKKK